MPSSPTDPHPPDSPRTLFFADRLPAPPPGENARETDRRVHLALESSAPVAVDRLAYGWVTLPTLDILYYAAPADRVPGLESTEAPGAVTPPLDAILLPESVSAAQLRDARRTPYADLRPRATLESLLIAADTERTLRRLRVPARMLTLVAALTLAGGLSLFFACVWREHTLAGTAERVASASASADLLATLDRLGSSSRSPFDLLAVVNSARPDAITFSRLRSDDPSHLTLEGRGPGVADVNKFADALRACGIFSAVNLSKINAGGGRATFELRLTASRWPHIADAPSDTPPPSARP